MKTRKNLSCIGIMLGMGISMLLQTQLSAAMPMISQEFGTTSYYSWVYSGYLLASTVTLPLFGRICDRYGYRRNYLIGGIIFFSGTIWSGLSQSMGALVLSRIVTGLGSGIIVPATYGMISALFPKEQMRKVFGFAAVFQIINSGIGSVLGGVFSTHFTWRIGLFILLPFELLGCLLVLLTMRKDGKVDQKASISLGSAIFLVLSLLITMYGLEKLSDSFNMYSGLILVTGLFLLVLFVLREQRIPNGILPADIVSNPQLKGLLIEVLLLGAVLNTCIAYLPTYMVREFGWTTSRSGSIMLIYIITMGIASIAASFLKKEAGQLILFGWCILVIGGFLGGVSFFSHTVSFLLLSAALLGIGVGILSSTVLGVIQEEVSVSSAGTNSIAHLMRNMGGTLSVSAFQITLTKSMGFLFPGFLLLGILALTIHVVGVQRRRDKNVCYRIGRSR